MSIVIQLSQADLDCLRRHTSPESSVSKKLGNSDATRTVGPQLDPSNPLACSEDEAYELLRVANQRCAAAVQKIKEGIILSGV